METLTKSDAETHAANDLREFYITLIFAEGQIDKTIVIVDDATSVMDIVQMIRSRDAVHESGLLCAYTPHGKIRVRRGRKRIVVAEFHQDDGFLSLDDVMIFGPDGNEIK